MRSCPEKTFGAGRVAGSFFSIYADSACDWRHSVCHASNDSGRRFTRGVRRQRRSGMRRDQDCASCAGRCGARRSVGARSCVERRQFDRDRRGAAVRPARSHAGFARRAQARASKRGRARPDGRSMHADGVSRAGDIREAEFRRGNRAVRRRRFCGAGARAQVWLRCTGCIAARSATLTCRAAALRGTNTAAAASINRSACAPSD